MYKCVLFDLDGTIADTDLLVIDGFMKLYEMYRPEEKPTVSLLASFSGPTLHESLSKYFPNCNEQELIEKFKTDTAPMYDTYMKLYDGLYDLMKECKEYGIKLGVITSKLSGATSRALKLLNIDKFMDFVISSDQVKNPKPDPEGINLAIQKLNVNAQDTLFVGDSRSDEKAAFNADIDCCLVTWNLRGRLNDTHPKYTVNTALELKEVIFNHE